MNMKQAKNYLKKQVVFKMQTKITQSNKKRNCYPMVSLPKKSSTKLFLITNTPNYIIYKLKSDDNNIIHYYPLLSMVLQSLNFWSYNCLNINMIIEHI